MSDLGVTGQSSRRWYHWLVPRFSLRTLLIVMTAFAVIGGYWIERAERQRRSAEFLTKNGVQWRFSNGDQASSPSPVGALPSSQSQKEPPHYFRSITEISYFGGNSLSPDEEQELLLHIARLPALKRLSFNTDSAALDWSVLSQARSLTFVALYAREFSTSDVESLGRLTQLKTLHLNGYAPEQINFSALAHLGNLEDLSLGVYSQNEMKLEALATLPKVKSLRIERMRLDDRFCEALGNSKTIQSLFLSGNDLTDVAAASIGKIETLETLDLSDTFVTDGAIDSLLKLPKLKTVGLGDTRVTFQGLAKLCENGKVTRVFTDHQFRTDGGFGMLGITRRALQFDGVPAELLLGKANAAASLEALDLEYAQLPAEVYERIGNLKVLTHLDLTSSSVSDEDVAQLANLRQLESLSLRDTAVTAKGVAHLAGLASLDSLVLPDVDDWESVAKTLRSLPKLAYLNASFGHLGGPNLAAAIGNPIAAADTSIDLTCIPPYTELKNNLAAAKHLQRLKLADAPWSDDDITFLASLRQLTELSLAGTQVTDESLPVLESLTSLISLDLSKTALSDEAIVRLAKLPNLRVLVLEETNITDDGMEQLAGIENIEELHLRGASITDRSISHLQKMPRLSALSIGEKWQRFPKDDFVPRGKISDEAFSLLAQFPQLAQVDIYQSELTSARVATLRAIPKLRRLTIEGNGVSDASFLELIGRRPTAPTGGIYHIMIPPHLRFGSEATGPAADPKIVFLERTVDTDKRLREVAAKNRATVVQLVATDVTAAGIDELAKLDRLEILILSDADLGDEIVPALCKLKSLRNLALHHCPISLQGIETLAQLPMLRNLDLGEADLSNESQKLVWKKYPHVYGPTRYIRRRN